MECRPLLENLEATLDRKYAMNETVRTVNRCRRRPTTDSLPRDSCQGAAGAPRHVPNGRQGRRRGPRPPAEQRGPTSTSLRFVCRQA